MGGAPQSPLLFSAPPRAVLSGSDLPILLGELEADTCGSQNDFQKVISRALITYPAHWGRHDWRQAEHEGPALSRGRVGRVRALLVLMLPRL